MPSCAFAGRRSLAVRSRSSRTAALKPSHWVGTVKVYLDKGNLNVGIDCVRDPATYECVLDGDGDPAYPVLDQQAGDDLVAATVAQWSGVPTSSFRATIAGRSPVDINGANFTDYIASATPPSTTAAASRPSTTPTTPSSTR